MTQKSDEELRKEYRERAMRRREILERAAGVSDKTVEIEFGGECPPPSSSA